LKVSVDAAKCSAHGGCNAICPEVFSLDEWGYAYVEGDGEVPPGQESAAAKAVAACPERAITRS
jgi:ferredoxin